MSHALRLAYDIALRIHLSVSVNRKDCANVGVYYCVKPLGSR